jgi:hypothetical protein
VRLRPYVAMKELIPFMVQDAQVHPLRVQVHTAIVSVLTVVKSHHGPPC